MVAGGYMPSAAMQFVWEARGVQSEQEGLGNLEGEVSLTCDNSIIKRAYQVEQNLPASSSQHPPLYPSSV